MTYSVLKIFVTKFAQLILLAYTYYMVLFNLVIYGQFALVILSLGSKAIKNYTY